MITNILQSCVKDFSNAQQLMQSEQIKFHKHFWQRLCFGKVSPNLIIMKKIKETQPNKAMIEKENSDFRNIPSAKDLNKNPEKMKKEIRKTSELHESGKTDNTEENKQ